MSIATSSEMRSVVKRWAESRGIYRNGLSATVGSWNFDDLRPETILAQQLDAPTHWHGLQVDASVAVALALAISVDPDPMDVGRCSKCDGRGSFWWSGEDCHPPGEVECDACSGSGRHLVALARLLLDAAMPDRGPPSCPVCHGNELVEPVHCQACGASHSARVARDQALVRADLLQAKGDQLGDLIGLALGPWSRRDGPDLDGTGEALGRLMRIVLAEKIRREAGEAGLAWLSRNNFSERLLEAAWDTLVLAQQTPGAAARGFVPIDWDPVAMDIIADADLVESQTTNGLVRHDLIPTFTRFGADFRHRLFPHPRIRLTSLCTETPGRLVPVRIDELGRTETGLLANPP